MIYRPSGRVVKRLLDARQRPRLYIAETYRYPMARGATDRLIASETNVRSPHVLSTLERSELGS